MKEKDFVNGWSRQAMLLVLGVVGLAADDWAFCCMRSRKRQRCQGKVTSWKILIRNWLLGDVGPVANLHSNLLDRGPVGDIRMFGPGKTPISKEKK
jgi:hypothetical protein